MIDRNMLRRTTSNPFFCNDLRRKRGDIPYREAPRRKPVQKRQPRPKPIASGSSLTSLNLAPASFLTSLLM